MQTDDGFSRLLKAYTDELDPITPAAFHWSGVRRIGTAGIATTLGPKAQKHLGKKSHFYIVGYDCPNLSPTYQYWEKFLVEACKKGASFTYYLGKPNAAIADRFKEIAKLSAARPSQIRVFKRSHMGSELAEAYANQWKSFHFAIFERPRQLWIELNHPEGETNAHNCYYLPPKIARNEPLVDVYKSRLEMVIKECSEPVFES